MKKNTVLIVEDEEDIASILQINLEADGYDVITLNSGGPVMTAVLEQQPAIILLDVMIPEKDGFEVCKELKANPQTKHVPIIFLTAKTLEHNVISGLEIGADDYITKPIKPKLLKSKIKSLLRRISQPNVEVIEIGSLVIDRSGYKVTLNGKDISLPRKEFELLFLLGSKPGKVFKREFILESVWGKDVVVGDRTIDVHIRKLREKIGDSYFKTIKGVGYKFQN